MAKLRLGPDGIHVFDRNTGINILFDEVFPPKDSWTNSPRQVSIALTNACDLNCSHCYAPKEIAKLNVDLIKKWMLELDEAGCLGIGFGGGEPTLYPQLVELCKFGNRNTSLAITMTTHGHRLSRDLVDSLKGYINFVRISMDGVTDTYENIRGRSFVSLLEKLDFLKDQIPFGLNYVVNDSTIKELSSAVMIAEKYSVSELLLLPEASIRRGKSVSSKTLEQLKEWVQSYKGKIQLSISSAHHELTNAQLPLPKETEQMAFAHIDANGNLKRNSFDIGGQKIDELGVMSAFRKLTNDMRLI